MLDAKIREAEEKRRQEEKKREEEKRKKYEVYLSNVVLLVLNICINLLNFNYYRGTPQKLKI